VPEVPRLAELFRARGPAVVLTGAGISTESGIPDFRSPTGIWAQYDPAEYATIEAFRADPVKVWSFYSLRLRVLVEAEPNDGHRAIAELERAGHVSAVVTQNIDGLHRAAGTRDVIEVHGTIGTSSCLACGARFQLDEVRTRLGAAADGVPRCDCGAALKPDVVLFGELLPESALARASALAAEADVLLCVGSSLEVFPIAQLPQITLAAGGAVALVTKGPTPYDSEAAVKLDGDVVAELEAVVAALELRH
jgi:NAD-dependent deacetylase